MVCEFILTAGKRKGQECSAGCGTRQFCGRHVKMIAKRESGSAKTKADQDLETFIGTQTPVDIGEDRIRKSVFALTINSNKNIKRLSPEDQEKLKQIMDHLFTNDNIIDFIECRPGAPCFRENPELIVEKRWQFKFEVGSKYGKIHAHALIEIDHRTIITMDITGLKDLFREFFGWNFHINVQVKKQLDSSAWAHYLGKGIPTE